ncbi:MAG TPA: chemotaxis protein CheB [Solirubrobacteraceae bacterium]|jgi:two-component system chemotaxis response regulator CheB|nr:chemotaxis protein CheB [Solirubrobacteraceae bacterium]
MRTDAPVRIVICEDSATYAHALTRFLERDDDLRVVGVCADGEALLSSIEGLAPDLITMDIELPGLDGLQVTQQVMRRQPCPILVISSHTRRGSDRAAAALASGALEAIPKAEIRLDQSQGPSAVALRRRIKRLAVARLAHRTTTPSRPSPPTAQLVAHHSTAAVVVGASTGGPRALRSVIEGLTARFPVPVLVVQHMAPGFIEGLARWLDDLAPLPVRMASEGALAEPGVWFAPDGAHLLLDARLRMHLDADRVVGRHRPAADVLLDSAAEALGSHATGVVLTGMGRDGAAGTEAIVRAGGLVIAEDASTAAVNGMPAAAVARGAQLALPVGEIAGLLHRLRPRPDLGPRG